MSNALAIASVTENAAQVLTGCLVRSHVAGATVTAIRPDAPAAQLPNPGVNIFLYQIAPNAALRNADLPTRSADRHLADPASGQHWISTICSRFYGDDTRLEQQRLLGAVATQMHAFPGLTRAAIRQRASVPFLATADLDTQSELVRFTPVNFSLEELSKLWSFLLKTDYVLSVAYQASVLLLQTDDIEPPPPLPVLAWNVYATPFSRTRISGRSLRTLAWIVPTSTLLVSGQNLMLLQTGAGSPPTAPTPAPTICFSSTVCPDAQPASASTQMRVMLPPGLPAGVRTAQVTSGRFCWARPRYSHSGGLSVGIVLIRASSRDPQGPTRQDAYQISL